MKTFEQYLEMATPRSKDVDKKYYHGTNKVKDINDIIKNGIRPPDLTLRAKNKLTPRQGKVYITPDFVTAQIYAIGADMAGHDWVDKNAIEEGRQFGYICIIDGKDLVDIEPDEDSIGHYIYRLLNKKPTELSLKEQHFLHNNVEYKLTPRQKKLVKEGEYEEFAHVGKKIIQSMNIDDKFAVIDFPEESHIAHSGPTHPKEIWKFDLTETKNLKRDGSNFFKIAKRIK